MNTLGKLALTSGLILISSTLSATTVYSTACINCKSRHHRHRPKKYTAPRPHKKSPVIAKRATKAPSSFPSVIASSDLGLPSPYAPSNLLEQQPSVNEDLILLQQRQQHHFSHPVVELSGGLEGNLAYNESNTEDHNLYLNTAELDTQFISGNWASGLFSVDYNNTPTSTNNRAPTSTLYLNRGFITLGDLNKFPLYMSFGKMYAPFGTYSSAMVTTPATTAMGRVLSPTMVIGAYYRGFNLAAFAYSGSKTSGTNNFVNQGGGRIGFDMKKNDMSFALNASYITNIADSQGMQSNGLAVDPAPSNPPFTGFSTTSNNLQKSVAGADVTLKAGYQHVHLIGEFVTAISAFDSKDLQFNGNAATPRAAQGEIDITWNMLNRPYTFGAFYNHTWEALALNLPENTFGALLSTSLFKHTVETIEYRRDTQYNATATGAGIASPITATGTSTNTVTAQIGVYF